MNDSTSCIQALSALAQASIALATLILSVVLWFNARRDAQVNYTRMIHESWNQLNALVLANPALVPIANRVFGIEDEDDGASVPPHLKRYFALLTLNILEVTYLGRGVGLVDHAYHEEGTSCVLKPILRDPDILDALHKSGYHTGFVAYCDRIANTRASGSTKGKSQPPGSLRDPV